MKKLLLILSLFVFSINAQTNYRTNQTIHGYTETGDISGWNKSAGTSFLSDEFGFTLTLTFESQAFGTDSWSENGINWISGYWADIRNYRAHNGGNHLMLDVSGDFLQADHNLNITELFVLVDDQMENNNSYVDFTGYDSGNNVIKTQRYISPDEVSYEQVTLTGFENVRKLKIEFDGNPSILIDDVSYEDLDPIFSFLTFESQAFGTDSWSENGINWISGNWADIRNYRANNGSNHLMLDVSGDFLQADHNLNITELFVLVDDQMENNNSYVDFTGYDSGNNVIKTQRYISPDEVSYEQVTLTGFENVRKLKIEFDGNPSILIDDVSYEDLGALPVELTTFTASVSNSKVELNWQTAMELNNHGFEIERIIADEKWEKIGFVEGAGNSNSPKSYSFTDILTAVEGLLRYRLMQIDNDGKCSYSKEITVELTEIPSEFSLSQNYPNPFNPVTTIKYSIPSGIETLQATSLRIYDILGKEVAVLVNQKQAAGNYEVKFDANNIASGVYIYRIESGSFSDSKRMMLVK